MSTLMLLILLGLQTSPAAAVPIAPIAPAAPDPQTADELPAATLWRLADPVAWLDTEAQAEHHLYHFDKRVHIEQGNGLRQGVAGLSEVVFRDHSLLRHFGETEAWLDEDDGTRHVMRYARVRRVIADVRADSSMILRLPGGYELTLSDCWVRVTRDEFERHYVVRNAGPQALRISGPTSAADVTAVAPGHEVKLTLVEEPAAVRYRQESRPDDVYAGHAVRLDAGVTVLRVSDELLLRGEGTARIGGARIRVPAGASVRIRRPVPADA